MKLVLKLNEVKEIEIFYGFYDIYILGGFYIEANPDFFVQIKEINSGEVITLTEHYLKGRDYKNKKQAVKYFSFNTTKYGKYEVSIHNYEDLIVKGSILSFLRPFLKPVKLHDIEILIE
ncbi:MAG: hypothetical protein V4670_03270 [Bacteroidota bacterium]